MKNIDPNFSVLSTAYLNRLMGCFDEEILHQINNLAVDLLEAWIQGKRIYICGNGGSAANALHIANDLEYGVGKCSLEEENVPGLLVEALPANCSVITCLANDIGYDSIFSYQIKLKGKCGDILIALSGSGNSENIYKAIETANNIGMKTYAILGFSGGRCKDIVKSPIHFAVNDMQVSEDAQMIVSNMCIQWLNLNKHYIQGK